MRMLVVEDELVVVALIQEFYCRPGGHDMVSASSVKEALEKEGPFDLVITDLTVQDCAGWETLIRLRARFPVSTPIVVVSGAVSENEASKAIEYGATDVLLKPWVSATIFKERVDLALARSRHPTLDKLKTVVAEAKTTVDAMKQVSMKNPPRKP